MFYEFSAAVMAHLRTKKRIEPNLGVWGFVLLFCFVFSFLKMK